MNTSRHKKFTDTHAAMSKAEPRRLVELASPCLTLILQLRGAREFGDPAMLRQRLKDLFNRFERNAKDAGLDNELVRHARFALVAFTDESILGSNWSGKSFWLANPLAMELFKTFNAGEEFFKYLDELRQRTHLNLEALEVYYLCLALGFKGKYGPLPQGPDKLRALVEDVHHELRREINKAVDAPLSPHGKPRDLITQALKERVPAWVVGVGAAALGLLIYLIASYFIGERAGEIARAIAQIR